MIIQVHLAAVRARSYPDHRKPSPINNIIIPHAQNPGETTSQPLVVTCAGLGVAELAVKEA